MIKYKRLTQLFKDLIPYFNEKQIEFLQLVDSVLEGFIRKSSQESNKNKGNYRDDVSEIDMKVEVIQKNLETIIERLKEGKTDQKRFIEMYPKWRRVRKDCTQKLKEIAESLNSVRFKCNVVKLVGYSTSCLGGVLSLASAIAIPFTLGLTTPLAIAGGTMTGAGCAASIGTSVTEVCHLKSSVDEVQEIIKEDEKCFKDLSGWLKHASELEEALAEILTIDIIKDAAKGVADFVKKAFTLPKGIQLIQFVEKTLCMIMNNLPVHLTEAASVISIVTIISLLVGLFVLLIDEKNRLVFDCAYFTTRSLLGIVAFMDDSTDVLRITSLFTSNAVLAKDVAKSITRGIISVVGITIDVFGIVLTSNDICNGSLSPEAEKISKAGQELEKETKIINEVYCKLRGI